MRRVFFSKMFYMCQHSKTTTPTTSVLSKNGQFCRMLRPCLLWGLKILVRRQRREAASDWVDHVLYYCEGVPSGERVAGNIARSKVSHHHHSLEQDGEANVTRIRGKAINCPGWQRFLTTAGKRCFPAIIIVECSFFDFVRDHRFPFIGVNYESYAVWTAIFNVAVLPLMEHCEAARASKLVASELASSSLARAKPTDIHPTYAHSLRDMKCMYVRSLTSNKCVVVQ